VATDKDGVVVSGFNPSFMDGIGVDIGDLNRDSIVMSG
jgi:hypothetical protein